MRSKGSTRHGTLRRYIAAPKRFLVKVRDFYVKNMIEFDGRIRYGSNVLMACPAPPVSRLPGDFSSSLKKSDNGEKVKELYRSIHAKYVEKYEKEGGKGRNDHAIWGGYGGLGRSYSVGVGRIGRIDEDEPCFFREEEIIMKSEILFPTCRR